MVAGAQITEDSLMIDRLIIQWINLTVLALLCACTGLENSQPFDMDTTSPADTATRAALATLPGLPEADPITADVLSVQISGTPGGYTLAVEIASPDKDCSQYADWWEVIDEEGQLLYRRVLAHSHTEEQPFTRTGGPVPVEPDTTIWVRAHMNPGGYGGAAMRGSVQAGFQPAELSPDFAADLAKLPPLPQDCAF